MPFEMIEGGKKINPYASLRWADSLDLRISNLVRVRASRMRRLGRFINEKRKERLKREIGNIESNLLNLNETLSAVEVILRKQREAGIFAPPVRPSM